MNADCGVQMAGPEGKLTAAQHEILNVVWEHGRAGATVAEVWKFIARTREVGRTTVLNQIDRLEARGWLRRKPVDGGNRYFATVSRAKASQAMAGEFVDDFFGGSASDLVMNLLGSKRLTPEDVDRLRQILNKHEGADQ